MRQVMLTTIDNPYDPFDQFEQWLAYDTYYLHNTCSLLARVSYPSLGFSDEDYIKEVERAIDEIIELDPRPIFKKVVRDIK